MHYFNIPQKPQKVSVLFLCLLMAACGDNNQWFQGAGVGVNIDSNGEVNASAEIYYDLGGASLPTIIWPFYDPDNPQREMGQVHFSRHGLAFQMNVNNFLNHNRGAGLLPNGDTIPMIGLKGVDIIEISSNNYVSQNTFYISAGSGVSMMGVAIMDERLEEYLYKIKGFRRFESNGVKGSIGIFKNSVTGKRGIAVFFDMSDAIRPSQLVEVGEGALLINLENNNNGKNAQSILDGVNRD